MQALLFAVVFTTLTVYAMFSGLFAWRRGDRSGLKVFAVGLIVGGTLSAGCWIFFMEG